jgi:hypothetical protein
MLSQVLVATLGSTDGEQTLQFYLTFAARQAGQFSAGSPMQASTRAAFELKSQFAPRWGFDLGRVEARHAATPGCMRGDP